MQNRLEHIFATAATATVVTDNLAQINQVIQAIVGVLTLLWWLRLWIKNPNVPPPPAVGSQPGSTTGNGGNHRQPSPFAAVRTGVALACVALWLAMPALLFSGCALNRPYFKESTFASDGETNSVREMKVTSFALWPATQEMAKQKASMAKTSWTLGTEGLKEDGGGTNMVQSLKELNSLLEKIK